MIDYRPLCKEYDPQTSNIATLMGKDKRLCEFLDPVLIYFHFILEQNCVEDLIFYVLIRSLELFYNEYSRYPGLSIDILDSDVSLLKKVLNKFLNDHRVNVTVKEEYIHEK